MDNTKLKRIKEKAISDNIPIIMDETLETIDKFLGERKISRILEIGTAVRLFCNMLF